MRFFPNPILTISVFAVLIGAATYCTQAQTVYVDRCIGVPASLSGGGSQPLPYSTAGAAAIKAPVGATIILTGNTESPFFGTYTDALTINKKLTLRTSGGTVTLNGRPASTQKVSQLTGEMDKEWGVLTTTGTESNFFLKGDGPGGIRRAQRANLLSLRRQSGRAFLTETLQPVRAEAAGRRQHRLDPGEC